jgi:hypothetical protein
VITKDVVGKLAEPTLVPRTETKQRRERSA